MEMKCQKKKYPMPRLSQAKREENFDRDKFHSLSNGAAWLLQEIIDALESLAGLARNRRRYRHEPTVRTGPMDWLGKNWTAILETDDDLSLEGWAMFPESFRNLNSGELRSPHFEKSLLPELRRCPTSATSESCSSAVPRNPDRRFPLSGSYFAIE